MRGLAQDLLCARPRSARLRRCEITREEVLRTAPLPCNRYFSLRMGHEASSARSGLTEPHFSEGEINLVLHREWKRVASMLQGWKGCPRNRARSRSGSSPGLTEPSETGKSPLSSKPLPRASLSSEVNRGDRRWVLTWLVAEQLWAINKSLSLSSSLSFRRAALSGVSLPHTQTRSDASGPATLRGDQHGRVCITPDFRQVRCLPCTPPVPCSQYKDWRMLLLSYTLTSPQTVLTSCFQGKERNPNDPNEGFSIEALALKLIPHGQTAVFTLRLVDFLMAPGRASSVCCYIARSKLKFTDIMKRFC
ncbi:uncharacterized protein LOC130597707 [Pezoporus wallicus]|uniref:uncharacterized protein LOC130597707 n=1 Tax=Pezoporus wallicus TaxID=35540 RepID=UPI00254BC02E|nr:uncharacterized protein LOC130597707 [Pezoporus wallicus]